MRSAITVRPWSPPSLARSETRGILGLLPLATTNVSPTYQRLRADCWLSSHGHTWAGASLPCADSPHSSDVLQGRWVVSGARRSIPVSPWLALGSSGMLLDTAKPIDPVCHFYPPSRAGIWCYSHGAPNRTRLCALLPCNDDRQPCPLSLGFAPRRTSTITRWVPPGWLEPSRALDMTLIRPFMFLGRQHRTHTPNRFILRGECPLFYV